MLELNNITKIFSPGEITETMVFNNFNLKVKDNQFVSVVGSNGSGKTSLLNLVCGSITTDKGSIVIDGTDVTKLPEYKRYNMIGRVYQNPALGSCPNMTIVENMALAENKNKCFGLTRGINSKRVGYYKELISTLGLGLEDKINVKVGALSGGQRQALSLLMATMTPIKFLILDEHTAALDPKTAETIMILTDKIVKEKNLTAIMVTHNLRYAVEYGNRMLMLHNGEVVFDAEGEQKANTTVDSVLSLFNNISVECGN